MSGIPSFERKDEAEFWSWLTECHVIPEPLSFKSPGKEPQFFRVISTDELRQLIADAFESGDQQLADKLLEIASQSQPLSNEILRKSLRLKTGEYLKLLYVKLLEETSFSDVIIRMLTPISKEFLESFRNKWQDKLTNNSHRLQHLLSLIESWSVMSPESRTRAVDMGLRDYEGTNEIVADYSYKLDDVKLMLSDFILGELERKLLFVDGPIYSERSRVYDNEFRAKWKSELDDDPLGRMSLKVSIDPLNTNRLLFTPITALSMHLTAEEQMNLFEKYGEDDVVGFIRLCTAVSGTEKNDYLGSLSEGGIRNFSFFVEVELPACSVIIEDAKYFSVESLLQPDVAENMRKDSESMMRLSVSLGKSIELDANNFFAKENERLLRQAKEENYNETSIIFMHAHSDTWNDFLKLATRLAKTSDDFKAIKKINSYRNRILNYGPIQAFVENLVESSIKRRSVVSFYVSRDVWRFLPQAIKETNWYDIANSYLASKQT